MSNTATFTSSKSNRRWTPMNILLMVIGLVLFWPLGLGVLAWIIWGDEISRMAGEAKSRFGSFSQSMPVRSYSASGTGNRAFDEYRSREIERLEQERRKIDAMRTEFEDFLNEVRRAKDQEEFEKFMSSFDERKAKSVKAGKKKDS